jgi:hypothetical protein
MLQYAMLILLKDLVVYQPKINQSGQSGRSYTTSTL